MGDPCDFQITRESITGGADFVRITLKDGPKVLARIDIGANDFVAALLGGQIVTAAFDKGKP